MNRLISVFDYLDFRAFLADLYVEKKESGRAFSYRAFSRRAGLKSPNHLKRVIDGERSLTEDTIERYAKALRLDPDESSYFLHLIRFNQARSSADRIAAYEALTGHRQYRQAHQLDASFGAYYSHWYIPAIREMALQGNFKADPEWIAERMVPAITTLQASEALDVLVDLGLLTKMDDGTLALADWIVQAPDETSGVHLATYHRVMLAKAAEAIDLVPSGERHLSALTLCLDEAAYTLVVDRLQRLRRELIALASLEETGERVVHIGLQAFPLTRGPDS